MRDGESQWQNGTYMYRYTDVHGERKCVYAKPLENLREKEQTILKELHDGIDYVAGEIMVMDLLHRYIATKMGMRYNTKVGYQFVLNLVSKEDFCYRMIRDVKPSDAKQWFIKLHEDGRSTITSVRGVLRPAFEKAVEDDIIRRNPFSFKIIEVVTNDSQTRQAISKEVKERFLTFIRESKHYSQYYDGIVILLGTEMRVSELYGLIKADIDFETRRIKVERQLTRIRHCEYYIENPKAASVGAVYPMTNEVYQVFQSVVPRRKQPKVELLIDGYTFCSEMANSGIDLKSLQYLMGHSDVGVTLNVYTHASYETVLATMKKAMGSG